MAHSWSRTVSCAALACALVLASLPAGAALKVEVDQNGKECFTEHASNEGDTFTGSFMRVYEGEKVPRANKWDGAFDLTVRDPSEEIVYTVRHKNEHRFEFSAEQAGDQARFASPTSRRFGDALLPTTRSLGTTTRTTPPPPRT